MSKDIAKQIKEYMQKNRDMIRKTRELETAKQELEAKIDEIDEILEKKNEDMTANNSKFAEEYEPKLKEFEEECAKKYDTSAIKEAKNKEIEELNKQNADIEKKIQEINMLIEKEKSEYDKLNLEKEKLDKSIKDINAKYEKDNEEYKKRISDIEEKLNSQNDDDEVVKDSNQDSAPINKMLSLNIKEENELQKALEDKVKLEEKKKERKIEIMNYIKAKNRNRKIYTKEELKQIRDKEKDLKAQFLKKINNNENDKNNHNDNEIILDGNKDSSGINIVEIKELLKEKKSLKKDIENKNNILKKQKRQYLKYIEDLKKSLEEKYKNEFEVKKQELFRSINKKKIEEEKKMDEKEQIQKLEERLLQGGSKNENEVYGYECTNNVNLSDYIYEGTDEANIEVIIKNNGTLDWPQGGAKLIFVENSQVKGDDIVLDPQKSDNTEKAYQVTIKNLKTLNEGQYESYVAFEIEGRIIGEKLILRVKIKKKQEDDIDKYMDKIKEFRENYFLDENDFSNERLLQALKDNDFDCEKANNDLLNN